MKYTPGPWRIRLGRMADNVPVFGFQILAVDKYHSVANAGVYEHANIFSGIELPEGHPDKDKFYTPEELEANARLIAAAPQLAEALQPVIEFDHPNNLDSQGRFVVRLSAEQMQQARAALKAAGVEG